MGSEKHLVQAITGRETRRACSPRPRIVVHNVATARAVHHAVRFGPPADRAHRDRQRRAIREPKNVKVLIGTKVRRPDRILRRLFGSPERLINGGR